MDDTGVRLMRATKAYIASLGTTGVLLAASLLMLAVVSAVVAFDKWPGGQVSNPVQTLVLNERPQAIKVSLRSPAAPAGARAAAGAGTRRGTRFTTGGRTPVNVGGQLGIERRGGSSPAVPPPVLPAPPAVPQQIEEATSPIIDAVSNPGTTTDAVADGTQQVTDTVGGSVGQLSPDVGGTLTTVGQSVAQTVRQLPLPDHIIPGH